MTKPFAVVLDIFNLGITDLSWGFNGNILLASSNDGKIFSMHFRPGILGSPINEFEKQLIVEKRYGATILNDYKKHTKLQADMSGMINYSSNVMADNMTKDNIKEKQQENRQ